MSNVKDLEEFSEACHDLQIQYEMLHDSVVKTAEKLCKVPFSTSMDCGINAVLFTAPNPHHLLTRYHQTRLLEEAAKFDKIRERINKIIKEKKEGL